MASASAATMPSVEPSQVPNQPYWVARVIVASIVLSPSSARKNATDAATTAEPVERSALALLVVGQRVAAQRPGAEAEERDGRDQRDPARGQGRAEAVADRDGHRVHDRGGDRDADQHRERPVAGGEGQRHELGLVAQLGDEHDAEADGERDQEAVHVGAPQIR